MAGQEDKGGIRPEDIGEGLDLSAATGEPRGESLAQIGKSAQDQIRDQVESDLGYTREEVEDIKPPVRVSHHDDLATRGPLHAASAAHRDTQNARVVSSEKERLLKDYDRHTDVYTEQHKKAALEEVYREKVEGEAMQNASQRLVEEAQENPNFDVSRSAQRLQELFSEERAKSKDKHDTAIIKNNAKLVLRGTLSILQDFGSANPGEVTKLVFAGHTPLPMGGGLPKWDAVPMDYRDTLAFWQALVSGQKTDIAPVGEELNNYRRVLTDTVTRFAEANGLNPEEEIDRLDRLFIRAGHKRALFNDDIRGGDSIARHQREMMPIREAKERDVMREALEELDVAV